MTAGIGSSAPREDFVDKHRSQLIQRVSNIAPILDELLDKKVIDQEQYDKIRALPTSQDKMRELYSGPLKASAACKKIFYESLLANEIFLIEDLSKERSPARDNGEKNNKAQVLQDLKKSLAKLLEDFFQDLLDVFKALSNGLLKLFTNLLQNLAKVFESLAAYVVFPSCSGL
uniref:CARD domain-containing protein n=1 Tax=Neolamprologus brichardi TaxID=32507 RepID=A0A3Q4M1Z0_NEOBR